MSDFVQQQGNACTFDSSDSWVILSPIEQSIKKKIEAVGTPLKDWDIQINYGIKTGFNDAFIISTETRDKILDNCQTEDERKRTEELIRPILRGRDIKRYGYDWADLWLIATFPSRHYDIETFPAVKGHLLTFGMERLEQTGKTHIVNGEKIKARKKTNNKWFEVQDSISYWEDFNKPKLIYPETTQGAYFVYDTKGVYADKTCFVLISKYCQYLQSILSSKLYEFAYKRIFSSVELGERGYQYNKHALVKLPVLFKDKPNLGAITDNEIYQMYNISDEEIEFIERQRFSVL
jgi:hypothetical protein